MFFLIDSTLSLLICLPVRSADEGVVNCLATDGKTSLPFKLGFSEKSVSLQEKASSKKSEGAAFFSWKSSKMGLDDKS